MILTRFNLRRLTANPVGRWTFTILEILGLLLGIALVLQILVLPPILRHVVARSLADLGLGNTAFEIRGVSLWQAELAELSVGESRLAWIGAISVDYSPVSLLHGRVRTIRMTGAQIDLHIHDGQLDLNSMRVPQMSKGTASGGSLSQQSQIKVPFDRLEVRASAISLLWEGQQFWIPMDAVVQREADGRIHGEGNARLAGTPVHFKWHFNPSDNQADATAEASGLDLGALVTAFAASHSSLPQVSSGSFSFRATYTQGPAGRRSSITASAQEMRIIGTIRDERWVLTGLNWSGNATLDKDFAPSELKWDATAKGLIAGSEAFRDIRLGATKEANHLLVTAAAGGQGWRIGKLQSTIDGLFGRSESGSYSAATSFAVAGHLPPRLVEAARLLGIGASRLGSLSADGEISILWNRAGPTGEPVWQISSDQMRVQLAPGDVWLRKGGMSLRGLAADLHVGVTAGPEGAALRLQRASKVSLLGLDRLPRDFRFDRPDPTVPLAILSIDGAGIDLKLPSSASAKSWRLTAPQVSLSLPPTSLNLPNGTRLSSLAGTIKINADASAQGTSVFALDGSEAGFESLQIPMRAEMLRIAPCKLLLSGNQSRALVRLTPSESGNMTRIAFQASGAAPISGRSRILDIDFAKTTLSATATIDESGIPAVEATIGFDKGSAAYKPAGAWIDGISGAIPVAWNAPAPERGPFAARTVQVRSADFPPINGNIAITGSRVDFDADWPVLQWGMLRGSGSVDFSSGKPVGQIRGILPPFEVSDVKTIAAVAPALKNYDVTGIFGGRGSIDLLGDHIASRIEVTVKNGRMLGTQSKNLVEGIQIDEAAPLIIDGFSPLSTPGGQKIRAEKVRVGKLDLSNGVLVFRVENENRILVEDTQWDWAGGRLYSSSFRLDRVRAGLDATISGDKLNLERVLPLFTTRVSGQGTVYGRLPVSVRWPQGVPNDAETVDWSAPRLDFGDGFLYATPGGGRLHVSDAEGLIGVQLDQQPQWRPGGQLAQVKPRLMAALRDLDYSILKVDFIKEPASGELNAKVFIAGRGHGGPDAQEIGGFQININGFGALLKQALGFLNKLSRGDQP